MRIRAALSVGFLLAASGLWTVRAEPRGELEGAVVVIDPGHGGADYGARGATGLLEKDLTLQVARRIGALLIREGHDVAYTRTADEFVSLAERTEIANRARGSFFLSLHANASSDPEAQGIETYFLSKDATDEEALRLAELENAFLRQTEIAPGSESIVGNILQELIWTAHLERSSRVASDIQRRMARLPGPSRGVKQAPFVVLMGVNMPAVLVEMGFLTNRTEERRLAHKAHQEAIAAALAEALHTYYQEPREEPR